MSQSIKNSSSSLLNDFLKKPYSFPFLDNVLESFQESEFLSLHLRKRFKKINQNLLELIKNAPEPTFLLAAVLEYMERVNEAKLLSENLTIALFEFWLNHFSNISYEENYKIRAKIVGKFIPREDFQNFFPIGMNKTYNGSHFVAAHLSPDVDTMVASLAGWMDAFAARVGSGLHQWLLPDGPPDSPVTVMMNEIFGPSFFPLLARSSPTLTLNARDLLTQRNWIKALGDTLTSRINHERQDKMITLVNEEGHYQGDWRSQDFEQVRQVITLFKSPLRFFENNFHSKLVSLFANLNLSINDLPLFYASIFDITFDQNELVLEYNEKQKNQLDLFLQKLLLLPKGIKSSFGDTIASFEALKVNGGHFFQEEVKSLDKSDLFSANGKLTENRPALFEWLKKLLNALDSTMKNITLYLERLDVVLSIKDKVLETPSVFLTLHSDVEEMRDKMENFDFLTVVLHEQDGSLFPVGIVNNIDLKKNGLGTVSLRDFCNLDEIKMASYLEVISIVDHHKSSLKTISVPCALIGDAQSCNVLIAEQTFLINDRYSLGGMTPESIDTQLNELKLHLNNQSQLRIYQRLLNRKQAAQLKLKSYIDPQREAIEYTCFLQAILDDTDLLSKVSNRDIDCIVQLLNRLKSIYGPETEIINLDDIPRDKNFAKNAAQRILQNPDMYSFYKKTFDFREQDITKNLELCGRGEPSSLFIDTKEQNGCARVGQTKFFHANYPYLEKNSTSIQTTWFKEAVEANKAHPEIDLAIHMMSTIPSADEVYKNQMGAYQHQDEIWFWTPSTQQAHDHLAAFLNNFQAMTKSFYKQISVEFTGANAHEFKGLFHRYFFPVQIIESTTQENGLPIAILRYPPGLINSRKAMITPCIPRLIP